MKPERLKLSFVCVVAIVLCSCTTTPSGRVDHGAITKAEVRPLHTAEANAEAVPTVVSEPKLPLPEQDLANTVWQATNHKNEDIWFRIRYVELLPDNSFRGSDMPKNFQTATEHNLGNKVPPWRWWIQNDSLILDFGLPNIIPHKFWFRLQPDAQGVNTGWAEDSEGKMMWDGHTLTPIKWSGGTK